MNRAAGRRPMYCSRAVEELCRLKHAGRAMLCAWNTRVKDGCVQVVVPLRPRRPLLVSSAERKSFGHSPRLGFGLWRQVSATRFP